MQKFNYQKGNKATGKIYIGLDHGYGNIKTAHRVFQTGIECYDEEPIVSTNYVKYRDKYYVIGESHLVYQGNKTETDDFYILTLAGLAEEMKYRGLHEADVVLAVGLPLAWVRRRLRNGETISCVKRNWISHFARNDTKSIYAAWKSFRRDLQQFIIKALCRA